MLLNFQGRLVLSLCEAEALPSHAKLPTQTEASERPCHASLAIRDRKSVV